MSQTIKALLNHIPKYNYCIHRNLCYGKDLTRTSVTLGNQNQPPDFLLQEIQNSQNLQNVFNIIKDHKKIMNSTHVTEAFQTIFELQKHGNKDMSTKEIIRHPEFESLCNKLNKNYGILNLNDAITSLKVLSYLKVPSNAKVIQVLLQILRDNINQLGLHELVFVNFLLKSFRSTPLIDALEIAIPIVFDIQFPTKVDKTNLNQLKEFLYFATSTRVSDSTLGELINVLTNFREPFPAQVAKEIVWAICELKQNVVFAPLLGRALDDLIVHIDELNVADVEITLSKLVVKYAKKHTYYYNPVFCDTCVNYMIDKDLGFKDALYMARKLGRIRHHSKYLLDYISKKANADPSVLETLDTVDVYGLVIHMCLSSYRPPNWEILKEHIQSMKDLALEHKPELIWMRYAAGLCLVGIYKLDVLSKALDKRYLEKLLKELCFGSDFENYFGIWQCLKFRRKELMDLIPSGFEPVDLFSYMKEFNTHPLKEALEKGIGGNDFVRTRMFSKNGIRIDHAILFRKGGFPVQIDTNINFIEDIQVQQDQQLVLVLSLDEVMYTINTKEPRETTSLSIKILQDSGYHVVPISIENWELLNEFEKIPYLMQAIKNKVDDDFRLSESAV